MSAIVQLSENALFSTIGTFPTNPKFGFDRKSTQFSYGSGVNMIVS